MNQITSGHQSNRKAKKIILLLGAVTVLIVCTLCFRGKNKEEILWEIPFQTGDPDALTFIEAYGEWRYPYGLESFATDGEMLFLDDSANSRIQVWSRNGRENDIPLPQDVACKDMHYFSEEKLLYIIAYNKTWVNPVFGYYVVDLKKGTELEFIEEVSYEHILDDKGMPVKEPTIYVDEFQYLQDVVEGALGTDIENPHGWLYITGKTGDVYFGEAGLLETDIVVPLWYRDGEIILHKDAVQDTETIQSANRFAYTLYESNGVRYLVYMRHLDENVLEVCRKRFDD